MPHPEVLPECALNFKLLGKHLEDAPGNRDKIVKHETEITELRSDMSDVAKAVNSVRNVRMSVIISGAAIVIAILSGSISLAMAWGRMVEKVDNMEKILVIGKNLNGTFDLLKK